MTHRQDPSSVHRAYHTDSAGIHAFGNQVSNPLILEFLEKLVELKERWCTRVNDGRILCECGRSIDECPIHGGRMTREFVERFRSGSSFSPVYIMLASWLAASSRLSFWRDFSSPPQPPRQLARLSRDGVLSSMSSRRKQLRHKLAVDLSTKGGSRLPNLPLR
jgi:hypothetical protein